MRANELRELPTEELEMKLTEAKEELFNLRFQNATGQLESYKRLGQVRKDVARIETVMRELELGIEIEHKDLLPPKPRKQKEKEPKAAEEIEASDEESATPAPEEVEARLAATDDAQDEEDEEEGTK